MSSKKYIVPLILAIFVVLVQLFVNIDSYLYAINGHYDSAVFFMCGKALFNGLIPYTEFTDSKGLLLWIIYGIGYCIDHYSYVGVFWISCFFYWLTLCVCYKTARLYLSGLQSLLASMGMVIPFFYWNSYTETKAENFCMFFISCCIYVLLSMMCNRVCDGKRFNSCFTLVGVCVVACLMMKWSIAVMMVSLVVSIAVYAYKRKVLGSFLLFFGLGFILSFLPFCLYFVYIGNWHDFIQEYFVNTLQTVQIPLKETITSYLVEWKNVLFTKRIIYVIYILPLLCLWRKKEWFASSLPFLSAFFFLALSIRHDNFGHYISIVIPFAIMAVIQLLLFMQKYHLKLRLYIGTLFLALVYIVWGKIHYSDTFFTKAGDKIADFERVSYMMAQVHKPTILNIGQESGFAMGYTLPACRYWISQMGATPQMIEEQEKSLMSGKADFIALHGEEVIEHYEKNVEKISYHLIAKYADTRIYSKHSISYFLEDFEVTKMDILLKRNVIKRALK